MGQPASSNRNFRLLAIALQVCQPPVDLARLAAQPGLDWIGHATDCDDGLRQALMTYPDVIVLPWAALSMKLLRALVDLRSPRFAPLVVMVTPEAPPHDLTPCDGIVALEARQLYQDGLVTLLQSLLASPRRDASRSQIAPARPATDPVPRPPSA